MVAIVTVGVLSVQGAVSEQIASVRHALSLAKINGTVHGVREKEDITGIDGLIIPGGESTTISRVLFQSGMHNVIVDRIEDKDLFIMGTCAGCVLLAKELFDDDGEVHLLNAMDMQVERNAFGRQRESFEQDITITGFPKVYHAVFIRAPVITKVWGNCQILSKIGDKIVAAREDRFLALAFHPELTSDLRLHQYFLEMID